MIARVKWRFLCWAMWDGMAGPYYNMGYSRVLDIAFIRFSHPSEILYFRSVLGVFQLIRLDIPYLQRVIRKWTDNGD